MSTKYSIILFFSVACCMYHMPGNAQNNANDHYRNFPVILTLQFHSLSLPFRNLESNFSNIGIGLGTEVSLNGKHNWAQQFSVVWYRNQDAGNGVVLYTQPVWRPTIASDFYTEMKFGAGYLIAQRPVESYRQVEGTWVPVGRKGKGMFTIPVGFSLGYSARSSATCFSPFASYQLLLISNYNPSIPVMPATLIQLGSRINPVYN